MTRPAATAMFVYGDASHDSRVAREADALAASGRDVLVVAHGRTGLPATEDRGGWRLDRVGSLRALRPGDASSRRTAADRARWLIRYVAGFREWSAAAVTAAGAWAAGRDVAWHGHDLTGLLAAARARAVHGGPLVYDSHELFIEAGAAARLPGPARRLLAAIEGRYARRADLVITVNPGIADELAARYGIERPVVVMNCPLVSDDPPPRTTSPLRSSLALGDRPILLHHGGLTDGRGIMETIAALASLPAEVALVLLGDGDLVPAIDMATEALGRDRVVHHQAVAMDELPKWVAGADVGVIAFQPVERNNVLATPNKLFECLAVGVPVVVSDFPEMRRIVADYRVGATCDPTRAESIASAIREVLAQDREAWFDACRTASTSRYSWQRQSRILLEAYEGLPGSDR
jgi:glycosyltransferase involved in cell wall biosynthesis